MEKTTREAADFEIDWEDLTAAKDAAKEALDVPLGLEATPRRDATYKVCQDAGLALMRLSECLEVDPFLPPEQRRAMANLADAMASTLFDYEKWRYLKARLCLDWQIDEDQVDDEMRRRGCPGEMDHWMPRGSWFDEACIESPDVARQSGAESAMNGKGVL